ncbi:MAG: S46 family peptidase [Myxococcota bacterium]
MRIRPGFALILLAAAPAYADEGMWTFDDFPAQKTKAAYGFEPDRAWLDHVRLSSVRLARGCSGSFVSPSGLVMTNHHCVRECLDQISTAKDDFETRGFSAKAEADERQCPAMELNQLQEITDVTARVRQSTQGLADKAQNEARKAEMAKIEKECAKSDKERCDVVTLYNGGKYALYKYHRYQDVRLAFAPEGGIAHFGGDPDNFNFPRFCLDMALVRAYENGKPAATPEHLSFAPTPAKDGDLSFVSGHPGTTRRSKTIAELEYLRDVDMPRTLIRLSELRGMLTEFGERGKEEKRISNPELLYVENAQKAYIGRLQALSDKRFFGTKIAEEKAFRAKIEADKDKRGSVLPAFEAIDAAMAKLVTMRSEYAGKEAHRGYFSKSFTQAITLVRYAAEREKPNAERLPEYGDAKLPAIKAQVLAKAPIYPDLEIAEMSWALTKLREDLGPTDPYVRKILGKASPRQRATELVRGTKLREVGDRQRLFDGGQKAIEASKDPMIILAREIDADSRAARKKYEDEIEATVRKNSEILAKARLELLGTSGYPDATFSLRLSYGQVKGFSHRGQMVEPITTMGGLFDRATGAEPFALPQSWVRAQSKLNPSTPMDLATTNDIIGGNSGSPLINKDAAVIGLVFDGNIYSLGGDFGFDPELNRAVAVSSSAILEALDKVYEVRRLASEIRGAGAGS